MAWRPGMGAGLLIAALLLAAPSGALAVTNAVAVTGRVAMDNPPSSTSPANTGFNWAHHITTNPAGNQPETAPTFSVVFPAPLMLNAQDFPTCSVAAVDGANSISPECQNAIVGSGTAQIYAGSPGQPLSNSVREDLTVTVMNGTPAGGAMLLVVNSTPSAPVAITNRVVPGTISAQPPASFVAKFDVPSDLQNQLGLALVITDLDVTISGTPRPITVGTSTTKMSYLQLPACDDALPLRQLTDFKGTGPAATTTITSDASIPCALGSFPDPPGYPTAPYTSPRAPSTQPQVQPELTRTELAITVAGSGINLGRVRARKSGLITLPRVSASCPPSVSDPCPVTGVATYKRKTLATLTMRLAAGAHSAVRLRITAVGRRLLFKKHALAVSAKLKAATPAGAPLGAVATKTVRFTLVR